MASNPIPDGFAEMSPDEQKKALLDLGYDEDEAAFMVAVEQGGLRPDLGEDITQADVDADPSLEQK